MFDKTNINISYRGSKNNFGKFLNLPKDNNGRITSLCGFENVNSLKELYCCNNDLKSLSGLKNATKLKFLDCSGNLFPNIAANEWLMARQTILKEIYDMFISFYGYLPVYVMLEITDHFDNVLHFQRGWRLKKLLSLENSFHKPIPKFLKE